MTNNDREMLSGALFSSSTEDKTISHLFTGEATLYALKKAVDELKRLAPKDHDVLIMAFDITVTEVKYIKPHTLLLIGLNDEGLHTSVVCHFSQLVAHVVYTPKKSEERVITEFETGKENQQTE